MESRKERIRREASALWRTMSDEPPPPADDGDTLLKKLVQLGEPERYGRLNRACLSDPTLAWPGGKRTPRD